MNPYIRENPQWHCVGASARARRAAASRRRVALRRVALKLWGNDVSKLTKAEIAAVALKYFGEQLSQQPAKAQLVTSLQHLIESRPGALECGSAADEQTHTATNPQVESDDESDDEEEEEMT